MKKINEEKKVYEYGCAMVYFTIPELYEYAKLTIDENDLYQGESEEDSSRYGIEDQPHTTLLYGLHSDIEHESLLEYLRMIKPFYIAFTEVSLFENEKFDVLKFDVEAKELNMLNKIISDNFEYTTDFPDYHPHCTIAYLKPGTGKKYINEFFSYLKTFQAAYFVYSHADGMKNIIDMNNNETSILHYNRQLLYNSVFPNNLNNDDTQNETIKAIKEAFESEPIPIDSPIEKSINKYLENKSIPLNLLYEQQILGISKEIISRYNIKVSNPITLNELKNDEHIFIIEKKNDNNIFEHYLSFIKKQHVDNVIEFLEKTI